MRSTVRILLTAALVTSSARAAPLSAQQQSAGPLVEIDSVIVEGNVRQATPVVLADFGIRPGDLVTRRNIQRGLKRLYASGQYQDVRVYASGDEAEGPTTLIIEVVEQPFIRDIDFRGLQHGNASAVRDSAGLEPNSPLDPSAVYAAQSRIKAELAKKGYVRADVDTALTPTDRAGEYRLIFDVDEGRRLVVARIDFEGNDALSDDELRGAMQVRPEGFLWWKTGEFREEAYGEDLELNLTQRYGTRGYLDFAVLGDTMVVDPETGKTHLVIEVSEGPQYRVADFQIEGNRHFPTELLAQRFNLRGGSLLSSLPLVGGGSDEGDPVFDTEAWKEATNQVRRLYTNSGYLYAQVEPIVERLPEDAEDGSPRVLLKWRIAENEQALINLVSIGGNTTTHERVIRDRVVMLPGDVYGEDRVVSSYQTIQGLGFFEPLPPQEALDVRPNQEGNINVTFRVKERQTGNVNFGASLSPSGGVAGFLGYEQPNLFGQAKSGRFRWLFGSRTNDIELSYSDPGVLGSRNSLGVSLRNSRDRFSFVGLGRRRQIGGSIRFGTPPLGSRWTRVSIGYSLFRDDYEDADQEELDFEQRELLSIGTRSSIDLRVARDTRNHPLFPTGGSRNAISLEFTGGILGGDGNYRKLSLESSWYTPIARLRSDPTQTPIDLILGLQMKTGAIFGDNPFFLERFFMGGVQYGTPLRGYEELTITPVGHVPRDVAGFSQLDRVGESFFNISGQMGLQLGGSFYVNAYYDAGNVWKSQFGLNPTDLFRGAGVGVTIVTPVGPLGLDYAYGFDRRDVFGRPDPGWQLHFRLGQIF